MNLPSEEECHQWFEKYKVPSNIREHCEMVRKVSVLLGKKLKEKKVNINLDLLDKAALLHDMFKMAVIKNIKPNKYHQRVFTAEELKMRKKLMKEHPQKYENEIFYEIFHDEYPELATFILHGTNPTLEKKKWEEMILHYSDMRVMRNTVVSLEERYAYFKDFYTAEQGFWERQFSQDQEIERKIFEQIILKPEDLRKILDTGKS